MLKKKVLVALSDESKQMLESFDDDVRALLEMAQDLAETSHRILDAVSHDMLAQVEEEQTAEEVEVEQVGVEPFESQNGVPDAAWDGLDITPDNPIFRDTPFTRAPRNVQVEWLQAVMANGEWFAAIVVAREYATDERHFRYMKGALTGRLREMWEEGLCERRDSHVRGSMFEYRLKGD